MRFFLGIDLPKIVKQNLSEQIIVLKKKFSDFTWIDNENFHITILFLGAVDDVKKIKEKVKSALYDKSHFYLYSYRTDLFMKEKITIYLGFKRERKIEDLTETLKVALGFVNDKKYIPHLTLARCRIPSKQQYFVLKKILGKQRIEIELSVKKIHLFESILTGKRLTYKKLASFSLL